MLQEKKSIYAKKMCISILVYSVENAYLDEKEEAILALKLLAEFTG